ncbi:M28 family metallopeptidase [Maricaulis sp.]|uniref:M28 family metallopeptidase n=1 Tax=Maricaulis sp. TaxID=1486257 RepID=UPI003A917610
MKFLAPALACLALVACGPNTDNTAEAPAAFMPDVRSENIEAHIRFLASDYLQGRDVGTDGYEIAANYVAAQMQLLGLEPAGENGGYFAQVPLQDVTADAAYNSFTLDGETFAQGDGVYVSTNPALLESAVTAPLVFVGYGVSAPNRDHDDYAGLDVTGKIVVIVNGGPGGLPSEERAHHLSPNTKRDVAAAHGAVGMITLTSRSDEQMREYADGSASLPVTSLTPATGPSSREQIQVTADVGSTLSARLFEGAEMSLEEVRAAMSAEEDPSFPRFELPHTVSMQQRTISEPFTAPNVVGMLRGSDPVLADEIVVLSAHLDHIGTVHDHMRGRGGCRSNDGEDSICNGAVDNASGVSIMLETARAFMQEGTPRRSVLFVALAGEEKGLLGSEHFAKNPTVPAEAIVANVNLDMPVIVYEFNDVLAFGGEHSSLGGIAERAAARMNIEVSPDPIPEQSIFVRSDHYNFVRQGVPSLFLMTGFSSPDPRWDEGEGFMGFLSTHYHRQTDQLDGDLEVLFDQGAKFANVNYLIAREIADSDERPVWNEGDFFGDLYGHAGE